jgi:hypothetical protein
MTAYSYINLRKGFYQSYGDSRDGKGNYQRENGKLGTRIIVF